MESGVDQLTVHELESLSDILARAALHLRKITWNVPVSEIAPYPSGGRRDSE